MEQIIYKKIEQDDHVAIYNIMKSLDKWFDENALKNILIDLKFHYGYIAKDKNETIGFITYFVYEGVGNIGWIGVKTAYQNHKIGKKLGLMKDPKKQAKRMADTIQTIGSKKMTESEGSFAKGGRAGYSVGGKAIRGVSKILLKK